MPRVTAADGAELHVKDWGSPSGPPVVLIHGWPLSADSWEHQALHLAEAGHRVVHYDRRGFGRSSQPWEGYDYDTFADDLAAVLDALDLRDAALVGFSMGGGEVVRYMARHGAGRVRKAALVASVVPFLLRTDDNPDGAPPSVFEDMKAAIIKDRPAFLEGFLKQFYGQGIVSGVSQGVLDWSAHIAFDASAKATLACVDAFGTTDFRPDLAAVTVPTLILHGTGDAVVPIGPTARAAAKAIARATLKEYPGAPHGLLATHAQEVTADLMAFL